ncbi:MAG: hypothetical protein DRN90_00280 [Thermoproteota archaeon]|nr:MAG: hypothetical protein DRN90_00280 [Candidatus Korarchaeota archaeon]
MEMTRSRNIGSIEVWVKQGITYIRDEKSIIMLLPDEAKALIKELVKFYYGKNAMKLLEMLATKI